MINIQKLAKLTGLHLSPQEESHLGQQLESVVSLLDTIKDYDIPQPETTRHGLLGLQTTPSKSGIADGTPDGILHNVAHPITGHAVEVKAFVE